MNQQKQNNSKESQEKKPHKSDEEQTVIPKPRPEQTRPDEQKRVPTEIPSAPPVELPPGRSANEGDREWAGEAESRFDGIEAACFSPS